MLKLQLERDESEETVAHYTMGSGLEAMRRETSSFYHYNHLGTALALTGADEAVSDTYRHDAWGVLLASTGSTVNPHTYVGRERYYRMPDAAMYHLGFRDYAQGIGRFVTRDPLFAAQEPYAYVVSRPTAGIDLLGLTQCYNFPIAEFFVSRCVQHYLEPGCCSVHCEDWDVGFSSELLDIDPWRDLPVSFNDVMDYARILWRVMKELSTKGGPTRDPRPTRGCPASIESWGDARICLTACGVFSSHQICATTPDLIEGLEPRPHPRWTVEKDVTVAWCGVPRVEVSIQAHYHNCGLPGDRDDSRGIYW